MYLIEYLPLSRKRISKIVRATSNLMNRPLFVIVDKVIREIKFPKIPSASTDIMETPATQNRKEVTEIKEKVMKIQLQYLTRIFDEFLIGTWN